MPRLSRAFYDGAGTLSMDSTVLGYIPWPNGTWIGATPAESEEMLDSYDYKAAAYEILTGQNAVDAAGIMNAQEASNADAAKVYRAFMSVYYPGATFEAWNNGSVADAYFMTESPCILWIADSPGYTFSFCPSPTVSIQDKWQVSSVGATCGSALGSTMPDVICHGDTIHLTQVDPFTQVRYWLVVFDYGQTVGMSTYPEDAHPVWQVLFADGDFSGVWTNNRQVQFYNVEAKCVLAITSSTKRFPVFSTQQEVNCAPCPDQNCTTISGSVFQQQVSLLLGTRCGRPFMPDYLQVDPWSIQSKYGDEGWSVLQQYGVFPFTGEPFIYRPLQMCPIVVHALNTLCAEMAAQVVTEWDSKYGPEFSASITSACADVVEKASVFGGGNSKMNPPC